MRSFVVLTAVLAITAGGFTAARAEDKKEDGAPVAEKTAESTKESAPAEATATAEDKKTPAAEKKAEAPAKAEPDKKKTAQDAGRALNPNNPWSNKVNAQATALAKSLNDEQTLKMAEILMGYDMMLKIRIAEKDVGKAVEECGAKNPDIKDKMSARLDKWKHAVDPALAKSETSMHASIKSRVAGEPGKVRDYFELIEKYGEYEEAVLNKQPVASPEACERLLSSMDRSQIALTDALDKIKWPLAGDPAAAPEKAAE